MRHWIHIIVAIAIGVVGGATLAQAADDGRQAGDPPRFEIPSDANAVVVYFTERFGELEADDYPTLRVFADGRVVRHRPAYMRQHGDFVGRLSADDLQQLVRTLDDNGILEFDSQAARRATVEVRQSRVIQSTLTDPSTIEIEVRLASYRLAKNAVPQRDYRKAVRWTGLRYDAMTYPEVDQVQNLDAVYRQLTELAERIESSGDRQGGVR